MLWDIILINPLELSVRKEKYFGERDWSKRPLFGSPRRRVRRWLVLLLLILISISLFLFPDVVKALLSPLIS